MARPRTALKRAESERQATAMSLAGRSQVEIADALGVQQSTISADLKRVRKRWAEALMGDIHDAKAQELALIEHVQAEALQAWHQSKRSGAPNPKFLDNALKASLARRRLLGLDAQPKHVPGPAAPTPIDPHALRVRMSKYEAVFGVRIVVDENGTHDPAIIEANGVPVSADDEPGDEVADAAG